MEKRSIAPSEYLYLGLYAFAGFGLEILLAMVLPQILGVPQSQYGVLQHCIYWVLTSILWGSVCLGLVKLAKRKYAFDMMALKDRPGLKQWIFAAVAAAVSIVITSVVIGGFKPVMEYQKLGAIKFLFQHVYYLFEAGLILLVIAFGQKFGEEVTGKAGLPYGGLFLAATWGLIHILTQGMMTGIYTFAMSALYGIVYLLLKKNSVYSYLMIAVMFIL